MQFPKKSILDLAINMAMRSEYDHRLGAVIFANGGRIISVGYNQIHTMAKKLHPKYQNYKGNIHAEVDCILNARTDLIGYSILIVRINKKNELRLAKPCINCLVYLSKVRIKKIYFSTGEANNPFKCLKLKNGEEYEETCLK